MSIESLCDPLDIETEKKGRTLQVVYCYKAWNKTGELELEGRNIFCFHFWTRV